MTVNHTDTESENIILESQLNVHDVRPTIRLGYALGPTANEHLSPLTVSVTETESVCECDCDCVCYSDELPYEYMLALCTTVTKPPVGNHSSGQTPG